LPYIIFLPWAPRHHALAALSYEREEHKSLINLRAAIARLKPEEPAA